MKPLPFILFLFVLAPFSSETGFYIGSWELNKENGVSTISLSENQKLSWDFRKMKVIENAEFKAVKKSTEKYDILSGQGDNCIKMTLQKISDNQCIGCNYKCYINENMIDEVFIARKNRHPSEPIPMPDKEIITLPDNYRGEFFIIYKYSNNKQLNEIKINNKGIGINTGEPELKQLFNANRMFRFEGEEKSIPILNPENYSEISYTKVDSLLKNEGAVIIQKGFNQSGRTDWNKEHNENVNEYFNIEYFEIR